MISVGLYDTLTTQPSCSFWGIVSIPSYLFKLLYNHIVSRAFIQLSDDNLRATFVDNKWTWENVKLLSPQKLTCLQLIHFTAQDNGVRRVTNETQQAAVAIFTLMDSCVTLEDSAPGILSTHRVTLKKLCDALSEEQLSDLWCLLGQASLGKGNHQLSRDPFVKEKHVYIQDFIQQQDRWKRIAQKVCDRFENIHELINQERVVSGFVKALSRQQNKGLYEFAISKEPDRKSHYYSDPAAVDWKPLKDAAWSALINEQDSKSVDDLLALKLNETQFEQLALKLNFKKLIELVDGEREHVYHYSTKNEQAVYRNNCQMATNLLERQGADRYREELRLLAEQDSKKFMESNNLHVSNPLPNRLNNLPHYRQCFVAALSLEKCYELLDAQYEPTPLFTACAERIVKDLEELSDPDNQAQKKEKVERLFQLIKRKINHDKWKRGVLKSFAPHLGVKNLIELYRLNKDIVAICFTEERHKELMAYWESLPLELFITQFSYFVKADTRAAELQIIRNSAGAMLKKVYFEQRTTDLYSSNTFASFEIRNIKQWIRQIALQHCANVEEVLQAEKIEPLRDASEILTYAPLNCLKDYLAQQDNRVLVELLQFITTSLLSRPDPYFLYLKIILEVVSGRRKDGKFGDSIGWKDIVTLNDKFSDSQPESQSEMIIALKAFVKAN